MAELAIRILVFGSWANAGVTPADTPAITLAAASVLNKQCKINLRSIDHLALLRSLLVFSEVRHSHML